MRLKYKIFFVVILGLVISAFIGVPRLNHYLEWKKAAEAVGALPYQIGLTKVVVTPCILVPPPTGPICTPTPLCLTKDPATCSLYSDATGIPAGGMGSNALFSNIALSQAGVVPGGQLIAGGSSPVLMDNGVVAGNGGCYGCYASADKEVKWYTPIFDYIIASFKKE